MKSFRSLVAKRRLGQVLFVLDLLWIAIAAWLAQALRAGDFRTSLRPNTLSTLILPIVVCIALWTITARKMSLTQLQSLSQVSAIFSRVTIAVVVFMPLAMGLAFMARNMYSRLLFVYLAVLLLLGFTAIRVLLRKLILKFRRHFVLRTAIVGAGRVACEIAGKIKTCPELMRDLVAFVHPANREGPHFAAANSTQSVTSLSSVKLLDLLNRNGIDEIILAGSEAANGHTNQLIWQCRQNGIEVCVIPHTYDLYSSRAQILDLGGLPFVKVESSGPQLIDLWAKRLLDLALVVPLLVISCPAWFLIAISLMCRRRRVFSSELRCGKDSRQFRMYRFDIPRHSPDLTSFDDLLDRLSLTELPQLWNVAIGDMSLVGPRPEDLARVRAYSDWQRQRLLVKPGITGLAQVQGLRDEHSSDEKSRYDLQYIHNWSPLVDLSLIVQTGWTLCFRIRDSRHLSHRTGPQTQDRGTSTIPLGEADVNRAQSGAD